MISENIILYWKTFFTLIMGNVNRDITQRGTFQTIIQMIQNGENLPCQESVDEKDEHVFSPSNFQAVA